MSPKYASFDIDPHSAVVIDWLCDWDEMKRKRKLRTSLLLWCHLGVQLGPDLIACIRDELQLAEKRFSVFRGMRTYATTEAVLMAARTTFSQRSCPWHFQIFSIGATQMFRKGGEDSRQDFYRVLPTRPGDLIVGVKKALSFWKQPPVCPWS